MSTIRDSGDGTSEVALVTSWSGDGDNPDQAILDYLGTLPDAVVGSTAPGIFVQWLTADTLSASEFDTGLAGNLVEADPQHFIRQRRRLGFFDAVEANDGTLTAKCKVTKQAADYIKTVILA